MDICKRFLFVLLVGVLAAIPVAIIQIKGVSPGETHPSAPAERLHPKYKLPARCFAYVGNSADTRTWKLPYLLADGGPDLRRLPKAIQAVISNYRGKNVTGIPGEEMPEVLTRLGRAAVRAGKMPFQDKKAAPIYRQLEATLEKLGRLDEVKSKGSN